jgi:hypothetical protein
MARQRGLAFAILPRMSGPSSRLAWVAAVLLAAGPVHAQGFFGPQAATSYQPEVDAYCHVGKGLRLQAQVQPYLVPAQQVAQISFALYGAWMVAAVLRDLLSPDVAKEHAVNLRIGVLYNADVDAGTQGPGNTWTLQAELTPRFNLPAGFLVSLRNRASFSWLVHGATGSYFRYRGRLQLEREFDVARVPITPFVNAELVWQQQPAMWTQFRMQAGLQAGFDLFAQGQTAEINWSAITSLQPSRSWAPQVGLILATYF